MHRFRSYRHLVRPTVGVFALAVFCGAFADGADAAPTIRFKSNGLDRFKFHGRVALDPPSAGGPVDPLTSGFGVEVLNEFGVVYEAWLLPGDLEPRRNLRYRFMDNDAKSGLGSRDGLYQVLTRFRQYRGVWYYTVRVRAFADFSIATESLMSVVFHEVGGMASITGEWARKSYGWRFPFSEF